MCVCVLCHFYNKTEYQKRMHWLQSVWISAECMSEPSMFGLPDSMNASVKNTADFSVTWKSIAFSSNCTIVWFSVIVFKCLYASVFFSSGYKSCNNCSFLSALIHKQLIVYISKQENTCCLLNFLSQCTQVFPLCTPARRVSSLS